jgi:hypothetical protein
MRFKSKLIISAGTVISLSGIAAAGNGLKKIKKHKTDKIRFIIRNSFLRVL